jgi:lauroyl/myristoyl acyltransferase
MRRHVLDRPASYYAIYLCARFLPIRLCRWLSKGVALIIYAFSRQDRLGFTRNLSIAFKKPPGDPAVQATVRRIFLNYGQYMVDFFAMPLMPPRKVERFFASLHGEETLQEALSIGRGAILISAHVGNWEFGGTMMRLAHYPLAVVAMAHNTSATNALVNRLRKSKGIKVVELDQSPFSGLEILRHLRHNGVVAMIGDKHFFGRGLPTPFFGRLVSFPVGPVFLAMISGAALIPAFVLKQTDGRYFGVLEEPIVLTLEGEREEIIRENLSKTARVIERYIHRYPDQWYCPDPIF